MKKVKEIWQVTWYFLEGGSLSNTQGLDISKRVVTMRFLLKVVIPTLKYARSTLQSLTIFICFYVAKPAPIHVIPNCQYPLPLSLSLSNHKK